MYRKLVYACMIMAMIAGLLVLPGVTTASYTPVTWIGAQRIVGTHLVPPRDVDQVLVKEGKIPLNATQQQKEAALKDFQANWQKKSDTWVNPEMQARALAREAGEEGALGAQAGVAKVKKVAVRVLAMAADFSNEPEDVTYEYVDNLGACVQTTAQFAGPRQGEFAPPIAPDPADPTKPYDNNTVWYLPTQTVNPKFYENLIFGYKGAGRVRMDLTDPRDGKPGINLKGVTVQDYYDHVAGKGNVKLSGSVQGWVTVDHPEAYYGADTCTGSHGGGAFDNGVRVPVAQLVEDMVVKFNAAHPTYYTDTSAKAFWKQYDMNKDGIVDTFWVIHAGAGQEADGGAQGTFSIWSHSSDLRYYAKWPNGLKVYEGNPATPADDIYVGPYTMQPENADVGVFTEEFGHNVFGLPDLYTTDVQGSIGFWAIMEAGAWGGYLGGSQPVGMPLWFRMIADCGGVACNWDQPLVRRNYDDPDQIAQISRLDQAIGKIPRGVRIDLPRIFETIGNPVSTGTAAYTGKGRDMLDITLDLDIAVPAIGTNLLTIPSQWDIETDWDYGYVMVNDGTGWVMLDDVGDFFTITNPNGNNLGVGLTGSSGGIAQNLQFDLSAYAGKTVTMRLRYVTDGAVTYNGWFVDDITLDTTLISDFDTVAPFADWTNSVPGWMAVPMMRNYVQYYLVEWRDAGKYDGMTRTSYVTMDIGDNLWQVSRVPYNIPAALVYYRNTRYTNTYAQRPNYTDPPSYGPKYQLLLVDMNELPIRLFVADPPNWMNYLAGLNSRTSSYDAGLTLQDTEAFVIPQVYFSGIGPWPGPFNIPAKPAVKVFDDAVGHYAGLFYITEDDDPNPTNQGLWWANRDGSAVIPAVGNYSLRVTHFDGSPFPELYGFSVIPPTPLGSGNPGDEGMQYGVKVELLSKHPKGAWGVLKISNTTYGTGY